MKNSVRALALLFIFFAGSVHAAPIYGLVLYPGSSLVSFDSGSAGTTTVINPSFAPSSAVFAFDLNPAGTMLFGIDSGSNHFGTINPATGIWTDLGAVTGTSGMVTGMSFQPGTGTAYVSYYNSGTGIYSLNLATGAATLVGSNSNLLIDIAFHPDGRLFGADIADDNFYQINPVTGAVTLIGSLGVNANYAQGMDFDPATGILYAALYHSEGTFGTGAYTQLTGGLPEMEIAVNGPYSGWSSAVPEPGTMALAGAGLLLACLYKRRAAR
jgi:hypothetical protein